MVRVITQETFDLVVKENMEEFDMERAEAVRDAKEQFEQQGVSLVNIVVSEQGSQVCHHSKLDIFRCLTYYSLLKVVVEAVKGLFGEEKEECLMESLSTIIGCCDGEKAQC